MIWQRRYSDEEGKSMSGYRGGHGRQPRAGEESLRSWRLEGAGGPRGGRNRGERRFMGGAPQRKPPGGATLSGRPLMKRWGYWKNLGSQEMSIGRRVGLENVLDG